MGHRQRAGGDEFNGEVAVGHCVEGIFADAVEAEFLRHHLAVDGERGARQRSGAQRQPVESFAAVGEALGVAREHFDIGQQVVGKGHRLCHLQVGESGHHGVGVPFGKIKQCALQVFDQRLDVVDRGAQVEPHVGGNLVVA